MLNIWGKLFTVLPNISSIFIIGYFKVSSSLGSPVSYSSVEESWYSKLQTLFIFDQSAVKWNFSVSLNGILCTDVLFTPCSSFSFRLSWGVYRKEICCQLQLCQLIPSPLFTWSNEQMATTTKKYFDNQMKKKHIVVFLPLWEQVSHKDLDWFTVKLAFF